MRIAVVTLVALVSFAAFSGPSLAGDVDSQQIFDRLKALAGTWTGSAVPEGAAAEHEEEGHDGNVTHQFRVSANGSVVMETMNPGTDHEMINMYHLDGDELMLTHYCAAGNQPRMRLDRDASAENVLAFDFDGGTNLDPDVDMHIHAARISFVEDGHMMSAWTPYMNGEPAGKMTFHLTRSE